MKVLMISGDPNLLKTGTEARERFIMQQKSVEQLDAFVWPQTHSFREIARAALATRYDVITAQDPFWRGLIGYRLKRRTGATLNLQVHVDLQGQSFLKRALATYLLRRADSIRVVSQKVADEVRKLGVAAPITILPVYVNLARVAGVPRTRHPRFDKTILWIGRFEAEKDPLRAMSILSEVRDSVDAGLVLLGSGSLESTLRGAAEGLPVEFVGWQEPAPYLARADVVLSTSPFESYGASIVEALSVGVPVVSLDVGVAREAGAIISSQHGLARAVLNVLESGARGELRITVLDADEWSRVWRSSLETSR